MPDIDAFRIERQRNLRDGGFHRDAVFRDFGHFKFTVTGQPFYIFVCGVGIKLFFKSPDANYPDSENITTFLPENVWNLNRNCCGGVSAVDTSNFIYFCGHEQRRYGQFYVFSHDDAAFCKRVCDGFIRKFGGIVLPAQVRQLDIART